MVKPRRQPRSSTDASIPVIPDIGLPNPPKPPTSVPPPIPTSSVGTVVLDLKPENDKREPVSRNWERARAKSSFAQAGPSVTNLNFDDVFNPAESWKGKTSFGPVADYMAYSTCVACFLCGIAAMNFANMGVKFGYGGRDAIAGVISFFAALAIAGLKMKYGDIRKEEYTYCYGFPVRAIAWWVLMIPLFISFGTFVAAILCLITGCFDYLAFRCGEMYEPKKKPKSQEDRSLTQWWADYRLTWVTWYRHIFQENQEKKYVFIFVWSFINFVLFWDRFAFYYNAAFDNGYVPFWLGLAKGFGTIIDLNASAMLLPVCRTFIRMLYNAITFGETKVVKAFRCFMEYIPLDKNLQWHKFCAGIIYVASWGHVAAHLFNYAVVKNLVDQDYGAGIFVTGVVLIILTHVMFCTSFDGIRFGHFELFWYTHHLFVFYYLFNLIHGKGMWGPNFWKYFLAPGLMYIIERCLRAYRAAIPIGVVSVTHMETDNVEVFALELEKKGALAHYHDGQYAFLKAPSVSEYQWHPFTIASAPQQDTVVFMIRRTGKETWTGKLKDYLREMGPKNKNYYKLQHNHRGEKVPMVVGPDGKNIIQVDGPYAAPTQHCVEYEVSVIVAGGIGVTPLRATMSSIVHYRFRYDLGKSFPNFAYFHWCLRWTDLPTYTFMFRSIKEVEDDWCTIAAKNPELEMHKGYELHIWISRAPKDIPPMLMKRNSDVGVWGPSFESAKARADKAEQQGLQQEVARVTCPYDEYDFYRACWNAVDGTRLGNVIIHNGRANWDTQFPEIQKRHPEVKKVGVAICGPKALGKSLKVKCGEHSNDEMKFILHKENF